MTCKLRGKVRHREFLPPADKIIKKTFQKIEGLLETDPKTYIAFWLACGCGLRRKEIFRARWDYFIKRDGNPWFSGSVGKNGQVIEVPVQAKAWAKLRPFHKAAKGKGRCLGEDATMEFVRDINRWMYQMGWRTEKKIHELRAYIGSLIYLKDPVAAMKFMRHHSIKVTEQFYARYGKVRTPDVL
jgi:integrase